MTAQITEKFEPGEGVSDFVSITAVAAGPILADADDIAADFLAAEFATRAIGGEPA